VADRVCDKSEESPAKVQYEAIGAALTNILTVKNIQRTDEEIRKMAREIQNMYDANEREWMKLNQKERELRVQEALKDWTTDLDKWAIEQLTRLINMGVLTGK